MPGGLQTGHHHLRGHGGLVGRLENVGQLEERDLVAGLEDQDIFLLAGPPVEPGQGFALVVEDVVAHVRNIGGLVVAVAADREPGLRAHRHRVQAAGLDLVGELGETLGIDLLDHLDVAVRAVLDVAGGDHHTARLGRVVVLVVHKNRLADEGLVGLLQLVARPAVEVLVDPCTDSPHNCVQVAGLEPESLIDGEPVGGELLAKPLRRPSRRPLRGQVRQPGVLSGDMPGAHSGRSYQPRVFMSS